MDMSKALLGSAKSTLIPEHFSSMQFKLKRIQDDIENPEAIPVGGAHRKPI